MKSAYHFSTSLDTKSLAWMFEDKSFQITVKRKRSNLYFLHHKTSILYQVETKGKNSQLVLGIVSTCSSSESQNWKLTLNYDNVFFLMDVTINKILEEN